MRHLKGAVTALTCALVVLPAGAAYAGSGPAPAPSERGARSTAPSPEGNPASAAARAASVCADAHQIGSTGYIKVDGVTAASVKQFYSPKCKQNYGYVWVWDSFKKTGAKYDLTVGVHSYKQNAVLGKRTTLATTLQEFWSEPTATVSECTAGYGALKKVKDPLTHEALSSKRC